MDSLNEDEGGLVRDFHFEDQFSEEEVAQQQYDPDAVENSLQHEGVDQDNQEPNEIDDKKKDMDEVQEAKKEEVLEEGMIATNKTSAAAIKKAKAEEKKRKKEEAEALKKQKKWAESDEGRLQLEREAREAAKAEAKRRREMLKITMLSIYVSEIPAAHPFTSNKLWIKCVMGELKFNADPKQSNAGDAGEWHNLNWSVIRKRNVEDRADLVIIIGSDDVIIGRYILTGKEFELIPSTETGYFEIEGIIYSGLGPVGKIRIVCYNVPAERPQKAAKAEIEDIIVPPVKILPADTKVYIKILTVALVDLKDAHLLEKNSPSVQMKCGHWNKATSTIVKAGKTAQWERLPWRLVMYADSILTVTAYSVNTLLGKVMVSLGEIAAIEPDENGFVNVTRFIVDGAVLSGRVKVVMLVSAEPMYSDEGELLDYDDLNMKKFTSPVIAAILEAQSQASFAHSRAASRAGSRGHDSPTEHKSSQKGSPSGRQVHTLEAIRSDDNKAIYNLTVPFRMIVISISILDTERANPLFPNSLFVNAACGPVAFSTDVVKNSGPSGQWVGLRWEFIINDKSNVRFTAWSKQASSQVALGNCFFNATELLSKPCDFKGITDIFVRITDKGRVTGKLKLTCLYEPYVDDNDLKHIGSIENIPLEVAIPKKPTLPILATVLEISAFDLKAVSGIFPNSPRVKLLCDRKSAYTKELRWAGTLGIWRNLCWPIPLNEGSEIMATVYSTNNIIGTFEMHASKLLALPAANKAAIMAYGSNYNHLYELVTTITGRGYASGKLRIVVDLRHIEDDEFERRYAFASKRNMIEGSAPVPSFDSVANNTDKYATPVFKELAYQTPNRPIRQSLGFTLKVTVMEVDVSELKSVHMFKPNSPYIKAACGKWMDYTDPAIRGGLGAFWTDLGWEVNMKDDTNLRISVYSTGDVLIGTSFFSPDTLIEGKTDPVGVKRLIGQIYAKSNNEATGKIKIAYIVEAVRDSTIGLYVAPNNRSTTAAVVTNAVKIPEEEGDETDELDFPMTAHVSKIVASDLIKGNLFGSIKPYVKVMSGNFVDTTKKVKKLVDDIATFTDVDWAVPIPDYKAVISVQVISGSSVIGVVNFTGMELFDMPRVNGVTEITKLITLDERILQQQLRLEKRIERQQKKEQGGFIKIMSKFLGKKIDLAVDDEEEKVDEVVTDESKRKAVVSTAPCTGKLKLFVKLRCKKKISIGHVDPRKPPLLLPGDPLPVKTVSPPMKTALPPIKTVSPPMKTVLPPIKMDPPPTKSAPSPVAPVAETLGDSTTSNHDDTAINMYGDSTITTIDHSKKDDMDSEVPENVPENMQSRAGGAFTGAAFAGGFGNPATTNVFDQSSVTDSNIEPLSSHSYPIKVQLSSLTALDLRSVHRLMPNNPIIHFSLSPGIWTAATDTQFAAGNFCEFPKLKINFILLDPRNYLVVEVKSKTLLIGLLRIPANKILHGKISKGGKKKITTNIIYEGKPAGKIRLDYSIESASDDDVAAFLQASVAVEATEQVSGIDQMIAHDRAEMDNVFMSGGAPNEHDLMSAISDN